MDLFREYALLVAVALPVLVIVAINVTLFVAGERGSLLLPGLGGWPAVDIGTSFARAPQAVPQPAMAVEEEQFRIAA